MSGQECRELERDFRTKYTERLLEEGGEGVSTRYLKKCILESGRELLLASCAENKNILESVL